MSWFPIFVSKKPPPKPEVYVSNVVEGDFNLVQSQPVPRYPLYPNLPGGMVYPAHPPGYRPPYQQLAVHQQASPHCQATNPLESIPFKLSSALDPKAIPITDYQLKSIKKQFQDVSSKINSDSFNYSFELEKSVMQEDSFRSK